MQDGTIDLKALRKLNSLTQSELAEYLGVTKGFISQVEHGKVNLPPLQLERLMENERKWIMDKDAVFMKALAYAGKKPKKEEHFRVPIVPFAVRGGALQGFSEGVTEMECEKIISPVNGAELAMEVVGESMAPGYPAGTRVLLKKVHAVIAWGEVYVIDSVDGPVLKRILPTEDENVWELRSDNPEYPPFRINTDNVRGVWRVLLRMIQ